MRAAVARSRTRSFAVVASKKTTSSSTQVGPSCSTSGWGVEASAAGSAKGPPTAAGVTTRRRSSRNPCRTSATTRAIARENTASAAGSPGRTPSYAVVSLAEPSTPYPVFPCQASEACWSDRGATALASVSKASDRFAWYSSHFMST